MQSDTLKTVFNEGDEAVNTERRTAAYTEVREDASTGFSLKVPAAGYSKTVFNEGNEVINTERRTAAYTEVREDASTGFSLKVPAKNSFNFGIYIHWPYCLSKCPYCDFYSKVKKDVPQEEIIEEYLADIDFYAEKTRERKISSVFFGGGTPSLIKAANIERIINQISKKWSMADDIEISLEANPNTQTPTLFADLRRAGINRLSLGVQALNDRDLKFLGRTHTTIQALQSIEDVLANFDNHSIDLIYALPQQNLSQWDKELHQAAAFGLRHLSLYQLTIEEGTLFYKKGVEPLDEENAAQMYQHSEAVLNSFGYLKYEVSNYAQPGFESKHNKLYWQGEDYIGIGPSAHGRLTLDSQIFATTHPRQFEQLTPGERAQELIIMGLRLSRGLNKIDFYKHCGINFEEFINHKKAQELKNQGLVTESITHFRVLPEGFLLLDKIIEELCS